MSRTGFTNVAIVGAARTPVGIKCGTLSSFTAEDLAVLAAEEVIKRSGANTEDIDAAVGANVYQFTAPGAQDIYFPRNVALRVGLRQEIPALMVQRICGSGLQTLINASQQIMVPNEIDDAQMVMCFAGETMSRAPQILRSPRHSTANFWEFTPNGKPEDSMLASLKHDLADTAMMLTADEYGTQVGVTRKECDEFAVLSHERTLTAIRNSYLNNGDLLKGMFAIDTVDSMGRPVHLARDECARETPLSTLENLRALTPNGLVSPGNASEIADGAAAILLADADRAKKLGLPIMAEIVAYGVCGVDPRIMGQGPVPSIKQALKRAGIEQKDVGLWEINEAFAAQFIGVEKELRLDREKVNVNGGAIAIGHPLAATGGRLITDLLYEMQRRDIKYGCASACIGGGQGVAIILRINNAA